MVARHDFLDAAWKNQNIEASTEVTFNKIFTCTVYTCLRAYRKLDWKRRDQDKSATKLGRTKKDC